MEGKIKEEDGEKLEQMVEWTKKKIRIHLKERILYFGEREIWWASVGVNIGSEIDGKHENFERPILVLKKLTPGTLWAIPMTSQDRDFDYYFKVENGDEKMIFALSQIRTISSKRLIRKVKKIDKQIFEDIVEKVKSLLKKTAPDLLAENGPLEPQ